MIAVRRTDAILLIVTLMLVTLGLVMVYSTSAVVAHERYHDSFYFLKRQLGWASLGCLAMWVAWHVPYRVQRRLVPPLVGCVLIALLLVFVPGLGKEVGGARRWIMIGPLSFQPSEFAKYILLVYVAGAFSGQLRGRPRGPNGYVLHLCLLGVFCGLIFIQPDLGTAVVLASAVGLQLLIAGLPWRYLGYSLAAVLPLLIWGIVHEPYRLSRLMNFLNPSDDSQGGGYQALQALLALGHGGLVGTGLGRGQQKLFYLPEAHTDFIFAALGEELGFVGAGGLVLLFSVLLWRILRIALRCAEPFGALLGLGVFLMLAVQILINLGVVVGLLPTKGLPLPFISLGGSNLCVSLLAIGTILNIAQEASRHPGRPLYAPPMRRG
jgi:cell division protein FtsW